jgi:hypothetical protein
MSARVCANTGQCETCRTVHNANISNKSFEHEEKFTYLVMTVTNQNYMKKL